MFRFVEQLFGSKPNRKKHHAARRRLRGEVLEDRTMFSVVGPEVHINSLTSNAQLGSDTASQPTTNGRTVNVWMHQYSESDFDIRAQIFDGFGSKIGSELSVASTGRIESDPTVAVDAQGNFVVAWTDEFSSSDYDIKAQRFSPTGNPLTPVITVANSAKRESQPSVAAADNGSFAVSYTLDFSATDQDVLAKRFNSSGTLLSTVSAGSSGSKEYSSSAAMAADGAFAVAYQEDTPQAGGGVNSNIRLARFNSIGGLVSNPYIAATTRNETNPDLAMDRDGNAVVAYQYQYSTTDWDIKAVKVNRFQAIGSTMTMANSSSNELNPSVALDQTPGDGDFVVAYQMPGNGFIVPSRVFVREMSSAGTVTATHDLGLQSWLANPSISINGSDQWFVTYGSNNRADDPSGGIYGRRGFLN